jgi:hypothetical protein
MCGCAGPVVTRLLRCNSDDVAALQHLFSPSTLKSVLPTGAVWPRPVTRRAVGDVATNATLEGNALLMLNIMQSELSQYQKAPLSPQQVCLS